MNTEELLKKRKTGKIDLEKRVKGQLKKAEKSENVFITVNEDVLKDVRGPSLAVKDNILVKGLPAKSSSRILEGYTAPYDATAVKRLRKKFIIVGKTACDPFGTGCSGTTSDFGVTRNPYDESRVPGGSSGGNGVALAKEMCDFALGSDTFGSVRAPASFCGVVGFRPSYGLVSRYGLMDLCMSMDTIGPMARDVYGVAYLLSKIAGPDERDLTTERAGKTENRKKKNYHEMLGEGPEKVKVLKPKELFSSTEEKVRKVVDRSIEKMADREGIEVEEVEIPELKYSVPAYYLTMFAEFSSAMQRFDGMKYGPREKSRDIYRTVSRTRGKYLNPELKRRIMMGAYITLKEHRKKWYRMGIRAVFLVRKRLEKVMKKGDFIVTATMPGLPWKIGEKSPVEEYKMDLLTGFPSIGGLPSISIPCGKVEGLPVGLQITGNRFQDEKVLQLAYKWEGTV